MNPVFITGKVSKGFQRGSKLLGYPTGNSIKFIQKKQIYQQKIMKKN
jgi:FAD synthase